MEDVDEEKEKEEKKKKKIKEVENRNSRIRRNFCVTISRGGNRPGRSTGAYDLAYIKSGLN